MSSFQPKGASLPQRFTRQQDGNNSKFRQTPRPRLCAVDGFDLENHVLMVTEVETGRKFEAKINPDKAVNANPNRQGSADRWNGNIIDARMEAALPIGGRVALENCITERKVKRGDQEVSLLRTDWITNIPDASPDKSFTGIASVAKFNNRIVSVQRWEDKRIDPSTAEGEQAIKELGAKMDQVKAEHANGGHPVGYGVQFETLLEDGVEADGTKKYVVINRSPPFDYISGERGADGSTVSRGHPMDDEHLNAYLDGYMDYVYGSQDQSKEDAEPGLIKRGVLPSGAVFHVEVSVYKAYTASHQSEAMAIKSERSPLAVMSSVVTRLDPQSDDAFMGKNWGAYAVFVLTPDKAPKTKNDSWEARNMVAKLFMPFRGRSISTMIKSADGGRVSVHPSIDRLPNPGENPAPGAAQNAPAPALAPAPQTETPMLQPAQGAFEDASGDDYFTQAIKNTQGPVAAPAAEPAAETASEPVATPAPAPASSGDRFRRRT